MKTDEKLAHVKAATLLAKQTLRTGDRIRAVRCGGTKRTYIFECFCGDWIVSKSGIDDICATHIDKVNGQSVDFKTARTIAAQSTMDRTLPGG